MVRFLKILYFRVFLRHKLFYFIFTSTMTEMCFDALKIIPLWISLHRAMSCFTEEVIALF